MPQTRNIPALAMRATFQPKSVNEEQRTVELVWTTGARVLRGFWDRFWEELSLDPKHVRMGRLNDGAPFLADHDGSRVGAVLGVVESATLDGKRGKAVVRFAKAEDDPEADKVFRKIRDGIIQNVSVGYRVHKMEKIEDGADKIPVFRAVDWEPYEISAVAMGADAGAGFRSANDATENLCEFITRGEAPHKESRPMETETNTPAPAQPDAARAVDLKAVEERARAAERERVSTITTLVRKAGLEDAVADDLVKGGKTVEEARTLVLDRLFARSEEVPTQNHIRATVTEDARDKRLRGMEASIFARSGQGLVYEAKRKGAKGFDKIEEDAGEFRGMSLIDMARECLTRAGAPVRGVYDRMRLAEMAMRSGYASANDFPVLLENVLHKQLRAAYETQAHQWRSFCKTDTVSDFRLAHRYMPGSLGTLPVVKPGAEYQNLEIPDGSKVSIDVETRGAIIAVGREMIVNDDLGAFVNLATNFGGTAGRTIEKAVFDLLQLNGGLGPTLSDGQTFFHASRGNIGTAAALTVASLVADKVRMRKLQDKDGTDYLDLLPRILLVPVELESDANIININETDPTSGSQQGKKNAAKGMFGDIVSSPRLTSATRRWMFTERKEAFAVVFLDNADEGPTLSQQEGFRRDGVEWKARLDVKVCPYDPKTALTNAGA